MNKAALMLNSMWSSGYHYEWLRMQ